MFSFTTKEYEKVMRALVKGEITLEKDYYEKVMLQSFEYSFRIWENEGRPDNWTFCIGDKFFTLTKDPNGNSRLIQYIYPYLNRG
jgi:hypothetical protein